MACCKKCGYPIDETPAEIDGETYHKKCLSNLPFQKEENDGIGNIKAQKRSGVMELFRSFLTFLKKSNCMAFST